MALGHGAFGAVILALVGSYALRVLTGFPQLLEDAPHTDPLRALLLLAVLTLAPAAFGAWMLFLARWLWTGHRGLRAALVLTNSLILLLAAALTMWGFDALAAAERSTARGGGLMSPLALLPFLLAVPLWVFSLTSLALSFWAVERTGRQSS
jgi:hypothetical protein